jgi:AAA+ ATPase superfamily predicted ATPase
MRFVGREREQRLLTNWERRLPGGQLSIIYGRRRIGKTRLVQEVFRDSQLLRFEGLEGQSTAAQQRHFLDQLASLTGRREYLSIRSANWTEILGFLADYVASKAKPSKPVILFFDEFQWMAAERVDLVSRLKFIWDTRLAHLPVHLILCGSISSFLVRKVLHSKALYGRIHLEIHLKPLELPDVVSLMGKRSLHEVVDLYMALGGVPQYLEMVDAAKSTLRNLHELCFSPHGFLVDEYERIFASHFGRNPHYQKILATLARKPNASRDPLSRACKLGSGGSLTQYLDELELAGFIERYVPVGRPADSRINRYRLSDPYLLFYFKFIRPARKQIKSGQDLPASRFLPEKKLLPWRGIAFERLCLAHADLIAAKLGFAAVSYQAGSWFSRADSSPGAQIDLMFIRADRVITLCEIKFRDGKIGKSVIADVQAKVASFPNPAGMSIEPVLISASGVTRDLSEEGYFVRVLSLENIFG